MLLSPAKTDEPIEIPFGGLTHMGTRDHVLDGGQDRTNPFAYARGDKSATWPFVKFFDPCLNLSVSGEFYRNAWYRTEATLGRGYRQAALC